MRQYEYELTTEKTVYDDGRRSYRIEVITNNSECYKELRDGISAAIAEYEDAEEEPVNANQNQIS